MEKFQYIAFALLLLSLTGCVPEERFWWAPDGEKAAVAVKGQLHLVDAGGLLSDPISIDEPDAVCLAMDGIDWFADSSGFVAHRALAVNRWSEFVSFIPAKEAERIEEISNLIPEMLRVGAVLGGDSKKLSAVLNRVSGARPDFVRNALLLALERQPDSVAEALSDVPEARRDLEDYGDEVQGFIVHQIVSVALKADMDAGELKVLHRSAEALTSPGVSSAFPFVGFARASSDSKTLVSIEVVSIDGGPATVCAKGVHHSFDWSADGRSLTTMAPAAGEGFLTQIKSTQLLDAEGEWLPVRKRIASNLVTSVMPFAPRIETLPNGDLLIASRSGDFPVVNEGATFEAHLYRFSIEDRKFRRIPTAPGALPMNLGFFVASPDGERVAVVEGETDAMAVVELATGKTEVISPPHPDWKCRTIPAWISADEISFAALDASTKRVVWKSWSVNGQSRSLSEDWPQALTGGWLELSEEKK